MYQLLRRSKREFEVRKIDQLRVGAATILGWREKRSEVDKLPQLRRATFIPEMRTIVETLTKRGAGHCTRNNTVAVEWRPLAAPKKSFEDYAVTSLLFRCCITRVVDRKKGRKRARQLSAEDFEMSGVRPEAVKRCWG